MSIWYHGVRERNRSPVGWAELVKPNIYDITRPLDHYQSVVFVETHKRCLWSGDSLLGFASLSPTYEIWRPPLLQRAERAGGPQSQDAKGAAEAIYCKPSVSREMVA